MLRVVIMPDMGLCWRIKEPPCAGLFYNVVSKADPASSGLFPTVCNVLTVTKSFSALHGVSWFSGGKFLFSTYEMIFLSKPFLKYCLAAQYIKLPKHIKRYMIVQGEMMWFISPGPLFLLDWFIDHWLNKRVELLMFTEYRDSKIWGC